MYRRFAHKQDENPRYAFTWKQRKGLQCGAAHRTLRSGFARSIHICCSYPIRRSVFRIPCVALVILPFKSEDNSETMNLPTTANASTAFFKSMFHFVTAVACAQSDVQNTITGDTRYNLETSTQPAALHMRKMIQPSALWAALSEKIFFLFVF